MARLIEAGLLNGPNVVGKEMPVSAIQIPKPKSRLISRDQLGSIEVDATEMKERKGIVPEGVATVFENGIAALVKIPISHVVAPIANDLDVRKESRHEVDPLLIGEEALLRGGETVFMEAVLPPVQKTQGFMALAQPDEAEVVSARDKKAHLTRRHAIGR